MKRAAPPCRPARLGALLVLAAFTACAPRARTPVGEPVPDPAPLAAEIIAATVPAQPRQASFTWTLDEGGSTVRGRGVIRYEAPERIRLDLFGPRNETYLSAALVGDDYRVPPAVAGRVALPSPALLWGGLGVVHPPTGARLLDAAEGEGTTTLRYEHAGELYQYSLRTGSGAPALSGVERIRDSGVLESVRLDRAPEGTPRAARYRNWAETRQLTLEYENVRDVEPFPEPVWQP